MVQRIVTMAINTGMRQGEIFNLTWFDLDLPLALSGAHRSSASIFRSRRAEVI